MPIKGGSLFIKIHSKNQDEDFSIMNSNIVKRNIKKGLVFKKIANSNMCYIIKGDSIMYFNCFDKSYFKKSDSIVNYRIKDWKKDVTNIWKIAPGNN